MVLIDSNGDNPKIIEARRFGFTLRMEVNTAITSKGRLERQPGAVMEILNRIQSSREPKRRTLF